MGPDRFTEQLTQVEAQNLELEQLVEKMRALIRGNFEYGLNQSEIEEGYKTAKKIFAKKAPTGKKIDIRRKLDRAFREALNDVLMEREGGDPDDFNLEAEFADSGFAEPPKPDNDGFDSNFKIPDFFLLKK